jgi:hypothetical protein
MARASRRRLSLALAGFCTAGLITATPATSFASQWPEAFAMRGFQLGMTISEFERSTHPDNPGARRLCSIAMNDPEFTGAEYQFLREFLNRDSDLRVIKCAFFERTDPSGKFMPYGLVLGNLHPIKTSFYFYEMAGNHLPPMLFRMDVVVDTSRFDEIATFFIGRYGPPSHRHGASLSNKLGTQFQNTVIRFENDVSAILLRKHGDWFHQAKISFWIKAGPDRIVPETLVPADDQHVDFSDVVATPTSVYSKGPGEPFGYRHVVYRNGIEFFSLSSSEEYVSLGAPIKTRDYTLIPVYGRHAGSGYHWGTASLLIEGKGTSVVHEGLLASCFECNVRALSSDHASNVVHIRIGRREGYETSAWFRDGALSVHRTKLDPEEPVDADTCNLLYEQLKMCFGADRRIYSSYAGGSLGYAGGSLGYAGGSLGYAGGSLGYAGGSLGYAGGSLSDFLTEVVKVNYPGFSFPDFHQACAEAICAGRRMGIKEFAKNLCRRADLP